MTAANSNDLTSVLETVREKVASYSNERAQLAQSLRQVISDAQELLSSLGEDIAAVVRGRRGRPPGRKRGRPVGSTKTKGTRKRRKMSAAARAKIAAAQRARWAKQKAAAK